MNKHKKSERGQALILIVFAIIGLIGITALTVDGGLAYSDRRNAQNAVDNAAMAAALAYARGKDYSAAALSLAGSNGYNNNGSSNTVTVDPVNTGSGVCPSTGKDITVTIVSRVSMNFARILGRNEIINTVSATSRACDKTTTGGQPFYAGSAVFATKTSSCGNGITDKSVYVNGSADIQFWGGGTGSASTDGNCIYFKNGEVQFKKAESGNACANITTAASSGGTFNSVKPQDGCGQKIYNQVFAPPPPDLKITCGGNATVSGNTMSPGNYSGTFPPNNVTTLQAGTYCIDGDFRVNANQNLVGNNVTIVMNTGALHWNGTATVKLNAPTSGDYKGLLIYYPPSNSSDMDVNGNSNLTIKGTILAQNSNCYYNGNDQIQKQTLQFICYTWGYNGSGQAEIMYDATAFFTPTSVDQPVISLLK